MWCMTMFFSLFMWSGFCFSWKHPKHYWKSILSTQGDLCYLADSLWNWQEKLVARIHSFWMIRDYCWLFELWDGFRYVIWKCWKLVIVEWYETIVIFLVYHGPCVHFIMEYSYHTSYFGLAYILQNLDSWQGLVKNSDGCVQHFLKIYIQNNAVTTH